MLRITEAIVWLSLCLHADSFFTLQDVTRVYPVVEIQGADLPKSLNAMIQTALDDTAEELGISTEGYSKRSLAILIKETYAAKTPAVEVRLIIGEPVKRLDADAPVFAITYRNQAVFALNADTVAEDIEDAVDDLLQKFADQYQEENKVSKKVKTADAEFARALKYETDFEAAMAKGRKTDKPVMVVLVTNFCPWCRKFEEQILKRSEVNTLVHEKYVPLILNKHKDAFPPALNLAFTPVVHFIDQHSGKSYHHFVGYSEREAFLHWLKTDNNRPKK